MADVHVTLRGAKALVKAVIETYKDRYPNIWENYTLVLLLVIREQAGVFIPPDAIDAAAQGRLPNLTSIHRALTVVKKDYQTPQQAARSEDLDEEWRQVLSVEAASVSLSSPRRKVKSAGDPEDA